MTDSEAPHVFLQWKGTNACLDFWCTCGANWHYDGFFASSLTCGHCGQAWQLPSGFEPLPVRGTSPLKLVYGEPVLSLDATQFTLRWPQPTFGAAKVGDIVTVVDEDDGCQRAVHADLLSVKEDGDHCVLTLKTRGPV